LGGGDCIDIARARVVVDLRPSQFSALAVAHVSVFDDLPRHSFYFSSLAFSFRNSRRYHRPKRILSLKLQEDIFVCQRPSGTRHF